MKMLTEEEEDQEEEEKVGPKIELKEWQCHTCTQSTGTNEVYMERQDNVR